jgi:beta-N-acetylhexosaminidase
MKPVILGIAGHDLTPTEAALFRRMPPSGVILFARNVADPGQLAALTASLRDVLPRDAVMMVDQEGGRVARLRPPHWRAHPAAGRIGALPEPAARRAAWITGALIGLDCAAAGLDVVCAPVLDLRLPGAHDVVGDRSYAAAPDPVARLGRAMADGLLAAGVQPVAKHAPGHGRARVDSHAELPVVAEPDLSADIAPFAANADLPWMMTAHIRYLALDADRPATLSPGVIGPIIRGRIGFRGILVTDDLSMGAIAAAAPAERAAAQAVAAGCDLALHCSGRIEESEAVLAALPEITGAARGRLRAARDQAAASRRPLDAAALAAERDRLFA